MTIQDLFLLILEYRVIVLAMMFLAPWLSYLICVLVPGTKEEPLVLNLNLNLALICLLGEIGYLLYASHLGGWQRIVEDSEFLFLLAPVYYVGVSLWVSRQRLPLKKLPAFRALQGLGMLVAAYLLLAWLFSKIRIVLFSYLPFGFLVVAVIALLSIGYLGYLKILGKHPKQRKSSSHHEADPKHLQSSIDRELDRLRRDQT